MNELEKLRAENEALREALKDMLESVESFNNSADGAGYEIEETPARKALGMEDTRNSYEIAHAERVKLWNERK